MAHRVAPRAESDLDDIWYYVAKESGSIEIANRLIDSITGRFSLLASFPYMGRSRDEDFGVGSRSFAVGDYVIVYSVEGEDVVIYALHMAAVILKRCFHVSKAVYRKWYVSERPTRLGRVL